MTMKTDQQSTTQALPLLATISTSSPPSPELVSFDDAYAMAKQLMWEECMRVTSMREYIGGRVDTDIPDFETQCALGILTRYIYRPWDPMLPVTKEQGEEGYRTVLEEHYNPTPGYNGYKHRHPTIVLPPEVCDNYDKKCTRTLRMWG